MKSNRSLRWAIVSIAAALHLLLAAPACRADLLLITFDPNAPRR
jgi:hypothetical protein